MNDSKNSLSETKKLSLKQALITIFLSIFVISGSSFMALVYYQQIKEKQRLDPAYRIVAVVQTSPEHEGLKTGFLAELLGLSIDRPRNLYAFDTQEGLKNLLSLPIIKEAKIRKIRPGTIHVDYVLRKPVAYVGDYTNTGIDAEGIIFPFKPFYTPKKLPKIYFGEDNPNEMPKWGTELWGKRKELAFALLNMASQYCDECSVLSSIDVTHAFALSDGQREMTLVLEDRLLRVIEGQTILCIYPRILRLRQDNYQQQLGNYLVLRAYLREQDRISSLPGEGTIQTAKAVVVDLRLSELAFFAREPFEFPINL